MKILITGTAGFIGHHLVEALATDGNEIIGIDNINSYYDTELKYGRLEDQGIAGGDIKPLVEVQSSVYAGYRFVQMDLTDRVSLNRLFDAERFTHVCNLAGQAGVRYSIVNPYTYIEANVMGFLNLLEACRTHSVEHLVYASSSSVYGESSNTPFAENDRTDAPVSLYAATKKSDETMAYTYSRLYGMQTTGMRFFTVYGPWGRPDMAPFKFLRKILSGGTIQVYNNGKCKRDFTYIDDIVEGIRHIIPSRTLQEIPYRIYNIGCSNPVGLMEFIGTLERVVGKKARKEMLGMQQGDVPLTYADTSLLQRDFGYKPAVALEEGLRRFYDWYIGFYG